MNDPEQIVSKSEFARIVGVDRTRVSHWIADGKIFGVAIVGQGAKAQIRVREAKAQLRRHLDIGQRFGNGIDTRLDDEPLLKPRGEIVGDDEGSALDPPRHSAPSRADDAIEEQIKRERLEELKRRNRRAAEEEALRAGRYMLAEDARHHMGKIATEMMAWIENAIPEIAGDVATSFNLPRRDVLARMKTSLRVQRQRGSAEFAARAENMPATIVDDIPDEEESQND